MTWDENRTENKEVKRRSGKHAAHSFFCPRSTCWLPSSNENEAKEEGESGVDIKPESAGERGRSEREREENDAMD